jgi:G3E family GTPase
MSKRIAVITFISAGLLTLTLASRAQHAGHQHSASSEPAAQQDLGTVTSAMSSHDHGHDHQMGPHMHMSTLRDSSPADIHRAQQIVDTARTSLERYKDFKAAENDGYKIFLPQLKQKMYHFTNWKYAMEAAFTFNPEHPTSLLYEKTGENNFKLIGAMYTAPARFSEDDLDKRVPLSVAQWHQHVNLCKPPEDKRNEMFGSSPSFGLNGSISTEQECNAAGGKFVPRVFGWMVHLYPYEQSMDAIWSVERQKNTAEMSAMPHHDHH